MHVAGTPVNVRIRVKGGTRSSSETSLCESCKHATVIQGPSSKDRIIHCSLVSEKIPFNVESCTDHTLKNVLPLSTLTAIATVIELKAGQIGFYSPKRWLEKHDEVLPDHVVFHDS